MFLPSSVHSLFFLLTDYACFADLHILWVQNGGGGSSSPKAGDNEKQEKLPDHVAMTLASDGTKDTAQILPQLVPMPTSA